MPPTSTCSTAEERRPTRLRSASAWREIEGIDLVCRLEDDEGRPVIRHDPGVPAGIGLWATVERGGEVLRFRPGVELADQRGGRWEVDGKLSALAARVEGASCSARPILTHSAASSRR